MGSAVTKLYLKCLSSVLVGGGKLLPVFHKEFDNISSVCDLHYKVPFSSANKFEVYYPSNCVGQKLPILFYIHGGGWATLDLSLYKTLCRRFAKKGFFVVNLNYPLSTTGARIEEMVAHIEECVAYVLQNTKEIIAGLEIDANSIFLAGDSAGAHLASVLALRATNGAYASRLDNFLLSQFLGLDTSKIFLTEDKDEVHFIEANEGCGKVQFANPCERQKGAISSKNTAVEQTEREILSYKKKIRPLLSESILKNKIKALFLFYGVYDLLTVRETRYPKINLYIDLIFGKKQKENKDKMFAFSPQNFVTKDFPPCFLASGEIDRLHSSQSKLFAEKLQELGIKNKALFFEKSEKQAQHGFMTFDWVETNEQTHREIDEFLKNL